MKILSRLCFFLISLLLLLCINKSVAQVNQWIWANGSKIANQLGNYGTQGISSTSNSIGSRYGSASWKDKNGNLWLFGGLGYTTNSFDYLNDLWKYDINNNSWTWIKGNNNNHTPGIYGTLGVALTTNTPGSRNFSMYWTDTAGNFWLFGGEGYDINNTYGFLNDLWKYDVNTNVWTWIKGNSTVNQFGNYGTLGTPNTSSNPRSRSSCAAWADNNNNLWMFGGFTFRTMPQGQTPYQYLDDLWKFNISTGNWTWVKGSQNVTQPGVYGTIGVPDPNNNPSGRISPVSWKDINNNLWLFGGQSAGMGGPGVLNDLWKYDISTGNWTWMKGSYLPYQTGVYGTLEIASNNNVPGGRQGSIGWYDGNNLWLFGGYGRNVNNINIYTLYNLNDLWKYDINTGNWIWMKGGQNGTEPGVYGQIGIAAQNNTPGARYNSTSWIDNNRTLWLFGGSGLDSTGNAGRLNDLWKINVVNTALPNNSLLFFSASPQQNKSLISWKSASELDISSYTIERSANGIDYSSIRIVIISNTSVAGNDYIFKDSLPFNGQNYYRLKITMKDGAIVYSEVRSVYFDKTITVSLFPNPARESFVINGLEPGMQIQLLNVTGQIIKSQKVNNSYMTMKIASISNGIYQVQIFNSQGYLIMKSMLLKQ